LINLAQPAIRTDLIAHEFDEATHVYKVAGEYVLATSDVIELNGLSDVSQVPVEALLNAQKRGTALHLAVQAYELGREVSVDGSAAFREDVMKRFAFYLKWREGKKVVLAGAMEMSRVYRHLGTEILIGGTPDMVAYVDGELFIIDLKTAIKQYGTKALMDSLKWKLQTQSYKEALEAEGQQVQRAVLHLHPQCGKTGVKGGQLGYEWHHFQGDDSFIWDSCIRVAMMKIAHGYKLSRKTNVKEPNVIDHADLEVAQGKPDEWWRAAAPETIDQRTKDQLRRSVEQDQGITDADQPAWMKEMLK
jgi:hypothetical protein